MDIDGTNYSILDNDLLATFTSFDPNKIPPFLLRESKEFTLVTIDNFTAINISPGMAEILNRMFKIKKNGKASRVSLKQNKKLLQWKSADINNFDINLMNNPLDPFDLGNFILAK